MARPFINAASPGYDGFLLFLDSGITQILLRFECRSHP